jgi:hypothetical protein
LHVIKWQSQPERRSLSRIAGIKDAREEIVDIQEETPSLNNNVIEKKPMMPKLFCLTAFN